MNALVSQPTYHAQLPDYLKDPSLFAEVESLGAPFASRAFSRVSTEDNRFSLVSADGTAMPVNQLDPKTGSSYLDVVFITWRPNITKTWYGTGYVKGQESQPQCFSSDGQRPDGDSPSPQATLCAACPHNAFGSGSNGRGKACRDGQRTAIVLGADTPVIVNGAASAMKAFSEIFGWNMPPMTGKNLFAINKKTKGAGGTILGIVLRATFVSQGVVDFAYAPAGFVPVEAFRHCRKLATSDEAQTAIGLDGSSDPFVPPVLGVAHPEPVQALPSAQPAPASTPTPTAPLAAAPASTTFLQATPAAPTQEAPAATAQRRRRQAAPQVQQVAPVVVPPLGVPFATGVTVPMTVAPSTVASGVIQTPQASDAGLDAQLDALFS